MSSSPDSPTIELAEAPVVAPDTQTQLEKSLALLDRAANKLRDDIQNARGLIEKVSGQDSETTQNQKNLVTEIVNAARYEKTKISNLQNSESQATLDKMRADLALAVSEISLAFVRNDGVADGIKKARDIAISDNLITTPAAQPEPTKPTQAPTATTDDANIQYLKSHGLWNENYESERQKAIQQGGQAQKTLHDMQ